MPFTTQQYLRGANYSLNTYNEVEPIDQINIKHRLLEIFIAKKEETSFGNGLYRDPVYYDNDSNAQNYFGADQVDYNERDPAMWTQVPYYNLHDGFWFDEDRLLAAGIYLDDDNAGSMPTPQEKEALLNLLKQSYRACKNSMQRHLAFEVYLDGSQSTKAMPGLEHLIAAVPGSATVLGIDDSTYTWWRNNADIGVAAADLIDSMEDMWKDCMLYGDGVPDLIVCGREFHNTLRAQAGLTINRQINDGGNKKGGITLDPGTDALFFHGVEVVWDPTLDAMDAELATTTRTKTCYFLNTKRIKFRPVKRNWMKSAKPERLPDRYVHYFAKKAKYALSTDQRNALGVIRLA